MAWLDGIFGADMSMGVKLALLFAVLLVALLLIFWLFKKIFGGPGSRLSRSRQPRLSVTDAAVVDDKRRLILVRRDNIEHLVMIGGPSDIVIEQNIVRAAPVAQPNIPQQSAAPAAPVAATKPTNTSAPAPEKAEKSGFFSSTAAKVGGATTAAGAGVLAATQNAGATVTETTSNLANTASDMSANAMDSVSASASNVVDSVSETASSVTSSLSGVTSDTVSTVTDTTASVVETVSAPVEAAVEKVTDTGAELIGDLASDLEGALGVSGTDTPSAPEVVTDNSKTEDEMQRLLNELAAEK